MNRDIVTATEVQEFYRNNPKRDLCRKFVCKHISEWSLGQGKIDWEAAKQRKAWDWADDAHFQLLKEIVGVYGWWDDAVSDHAGLPKSNIAWTYHPVTFLRWLQEYVEDDPRDKQCVQDVVPFLAGAYTGGVREENVWRVVVPPLKAHVASGGAEQMPSLQTCHQELPDERRLPGRVNGRE